MDDVNPDSSGMPELPDHLGQVIEAVRLLESGGRLIKCVGLPLSYAVHTSHTTWLERVTRVTLERSDDSGPYQPKYWADDTELPRPSDLTEIRIYSMWHEAVIEQANMP